MSKTRLTWRSPEDGKSYLKPLDPDCGRCDLEKEQCERHRRMVVEKLAKYEDTGLEPEEILNGRMRGWILTEEELPADPDEAVLIQISGIPKRNITLINAYELATYSEEDGWMIESYPGWKGAVPVAWMPMPEPYQSEEAEE